MGFSLLNQLIGPWENVRAGLSTDLRRVTDAINPLMDAIDNAPPLSGLVTLADVATVPLDASAGTMFALSASANRTIARPTNPTPGQLITLAHFATGANRTLSLVAAGFRFGSTITSLSATISGKTDYIQCLYDSNVSLWNVVLVVKGF